MPRPDPGSPAARARACGPGMPALGISLGLHGAALACLLWSWQARPPERLPVIAVELVQAADAIGVAVEEAGETSPSLRATAPDPAETAERATDPGTPADRGAPDERPAAVERTAEPPAAATELPSSPGREAPPPAPTEPLPDPAKSKRPPREASRAETARAERTAKPDPRKGEALAALPATARGGARLGDLLDKPETAPRYNGGGLANAPPRYPYLARRRGQEGRVVLRVQVSALGAPAAVRVRRSSGHRLLDEAAIEAVKTWRFVPASRGGAAVAGAVDVPVSFKLTNW